MPYIIITLLKPSYFEVDGFQPHLMCPLLGTMCYFLSSFENLLFFLIFVSPHRPLFLLFLKNACFKVSLYYLTLYLQ